MNLEYSIANNRGIITLNNPPQNRLTSPVFEDISVLSSFFTTPGLKSVIIQGSGRHFSTGADLSQLKKDIADNKDFISLLKHGKDLIQTICYAQVPVVAVIRGSCFGAGLEIALACHFRFASHNALLGFPESEQCILPGLGGTIISQDILKNNQIISMVLSGKLINGKEAKEIGLIDEIDSTQNILSKAETFLDSLVSNRSSILIHSIMQSIHNGKKMPRKEALKHESLLFDSLIRTSSSSQE